MGYVPPTPLSAYHMLYLPKGASIVRMDQSVSREAFDEWVRHFSTPQMVLRHDLPHTYQHYVSDLYGDRGRDWMPLLNALATILPIMLILAIGAAIR